MFGIAKLLSCCIGSAFTLSVSAQTVGDEKKDSLQGHLQGVTVSAERSDLKVEDGRIGYDLRPIARRYTVDNAWEALAKLPGVVEKDGAFQLTGQTVTVILNGKPTTMTGAQLATLLKNTPVNRVEKVSDNVSVAYTGSYSPSGKGYSTTQGSFQNSIVGNDGRNFLHNASFNYMSGFGLQMGGDYTYYKL